MQNLYFYRNKSFITLVLLLSISVILMFFNVKLNYLNLRQVLFFITYPVQYTVSSVGDFFTSSATGISKIRELEEDLRMTRLSLDKYKKTLLPFSQIQRENEDLKKIIGIKSKIEYNTVYGRIVFRDPGLTGDYFIIDKGAFDGIRPDMPVVSYNDNGDIFLIGKTTEVNASACRSGSLRRRICISASSLNSADTWECSGATDPGTRTASPNIFPSKPILSWARMLT